MKTISKQNILKTFRPTKSIINVSNFQRNNGWLTNGFFAVSEKLEPKSSKEYRFRDSDVNVQRLVDEITEKLDLYEEAEVINHVEVEGWGSNFIIKLKSENFESWVNPRYISYLYQGMAFYKDLKIMIRKEKHHPVVFAVDGEVLGLVMPFKRQEDL